MLFFLGYILPYLAAAVFLAGMGWQTWTWLRTPAPFSLTLLLTVTEGDHPVAAVAKELMVFRSLLRSDRALWLWAWSMHVALALIIVGHLVGIGLLARQFCYLGLSAESSAWLSTTSGTALGLLMAVALAMLFWRRLAVAEVRRLSDPSDYFDLLLLMAVVLSGLWLRASANGLNSAAVRAYMAGLLTCQWAPIPNQWSFVMHFSLVNLLLLYFPFSKLVHLSGALVSRALVAGRRRCIPRPPTAGLRPSFCHAGGAIHRETTPAPCQGT